MVWNVATPELNCTFCVTLMNNIKIHSFSFTFIDYYIWVELFIHRVKDFLTGKACSTCLAMSGVLHVSVWNFVKLGKTVNITSAEARLTLGSCTMEYKQLDMFTQSTQCCSAWPKPILPIWKMQTLFPCYRDRVTIFEYKSPKIQISYLTQILWLFCTFEFIYWCAFFGKYLDLGTFRNELFW